MDEPLHVIGLRASNVKRLETVDITAEAGLVIVGGRNGSGKSSLLDSIWFALGGRSAQRDTPQPIRDGEQTAEVTLSLGDGDDGPTLIVERTWRGDDSTLVVRAGDGTRLASPQAVLDALAGAGAFDPLRFAGLLAREQREVLLGLVELPFDLDELDEERKATYDQRTDRNRELRTVEAQIEGLPRPVDMPDEVPSITDALAAHAVGRELINENNATRAAYHRATVALDEAADQLNVAAAALVVAQERRTHAAEALAVRAAEFDALVPDPDLAALDQAVRDAEQWSAAANDRKLLDMLEERRQELAAEVHQCEEFMADIDERKARGLAEAKMPYEGLGFGEEAGITYQGKPFSQASAAEKLRVAAAIAMAGEPRIRVMTIHDGSLLDDDNLAMLAEMADAHQFQVFLEVVGDDGQASIVIEEGKVRG